MTKEITVENNVIGPLATITMQLKYSDFQTFENITSCSGCPVGFRMQHCGRGLLNTQELESANNYRPRVCKLRMIDLERMFANMDTIQILGGNLHAYFNDKIFLERNYASCLYKNDMFEVWELTKAVFDSICELDDEQWVEKYPESWWRFAEGSNLRKPTDEITVNGKKLLAWKSIYSVDDDEVGEINCKSLTSYLSNYVGASNGKNVCAVTTDLAKYNNMTLAELWNEYEPVKEAQ